MRGRLSSHVHRQAHSHKLCVLLTCPEAPVGPAMGHVQIHRSCAIAVVQHVCQSRRQVLRTGVGHLLPKVGDPASAAQVPSLSDKTHSTFTLHTLAFAWQSDIELMRRAGFSAQAAACLHRGSRRLGVRTRTRWRMEETGQEDLVLPAP